MANKRDTSRQKRAKQNRAQRDALKARTEAAQVPAEERKTKASAAPVAAPAAKDGRGGAKRERPPRPGDRPVDLDALEGNWLGKRMQVPGGRQVLTGALLTIVITGVMLFWKFPTADAPLLSSSVAAVNELTGQDLTVTAAQDYPTTERIWQVFTPTGTVAVLVVPLLSMLLASWAILKPYRRKVWIGASLVVALITLVGFIMYLFPVGFLTFAVWRAAKVEGPMRAVKARSKAAEAEAAATSDDAS